MNIVYNIMVFLHIIGAAMIVGIWIGQMKKPTVHPRQFDGAILQLHHRHRHDGLIPALDMDANYVKLGIKFVIALVVGVLAFIGRRKYKKGEPVSKGLAHSVGGLRMLNVAIADPVAVNPHCTRPTTAPPPRGVRRRVVASPPVELGRPALNRQQIRQWVTIL